MNICGIVFAAGLSWADANIWRHTLVFTHTEYASPHPRYLCIPCANIQVQYVMTDSNWQVVSECRLVPCLLYAVNVIVCLLKYSLLSTLSTRLCHQSSQHIYVFLSSLLRVPTSFEHLLF